MTQWVRELSAQPDNLNLFPGTYMIEGEKHLPQIGL